MTSPLGGPGLLCLSRRRVLVNYDVLRANNGKFELLCDSVLRAELGNIFQAESYFGYC